MGLIVDGDGWMDMLQSRNKTSNTYNEETAEEIVDAVFSRYYSLFEEFQRRMSKLHENLEEID